MSARIVLNLAQGREVVIVKLSTPSLEALQRVLAKELEIAAGEAAPAAPGGCR